MSRNAAQAARPIPFKELVRHLGNYYDEESSKTILAHAEIPVDNIPFSNRGRENWTGILQEVRRLDLLDQLLRILTEEYGTDPVLARAAGPGISNWPPMPTRHERGILSVVVKILGVIPVIPVLIVGMLTDPYAQLGIALGDRVDPGEVLVDDKGFVWTLVESAFSSWPSGLLSGVLLFALLVAMSLVILRLTGVFQFSVGPRGRIFAVWAVIAGFLTISCMLIFFLPDFRAAGQVENLLDHLRFEGQFAQIGSDSNSMREVSRTRKRAAEIYSWFHGLESEPERSSPDDELIQQIVMQEGYTRPGPVNSKKERFWENFSQISSYFEHLASKFFIAVTSIILMGICVTLLAVRMGPLSLFSMCMLMLVAVVLCAVSLHSTHVSYARLQLAAAYLENYKPIDPMVTWPFVELYLENAKAQRSEPLSVKNWWPIKPSQVEPSHAGFSCAVLSGSGNGQYKPWIAIGPEHQFEDPKGEVLLSIGEELCNDCCPGIEDSCSIRLVVYDGLASSSERILTLECPS